MKTTTTERKWTADKPIGWKERYTITVRQDQLETVKGWFTRGITVRQSHYMPECAMSFQPIDNDEVHHWKFAGDTVVERIPAEQCVELFKVVVLETEWDVGVPDKCRYCVDGKRTPENNPVLIRPEQDCELCGNAIGFSFDRPYHAHPHVSGQDTQCGNVRQAGECWCCGGTGMGKRYLSEMSKKERNQAIREVKAGCHTVQYAEVERIAVALGVS